METSHKRSSEPKGGRQCETAYKEERGIQTKKINLGNF